MNEYIKFFEEVKKHPHDEWIHEHLDTLYHLVKDTNAQSVIELGVQTGQSTAAFLAALSETGGKLYSVDINPLWGRIANIKAPFWKFTQSDDLKLDTERVVPYADIIFIDTSHEYKHTLHELYWYSYCLEDGGIFVLHDTFNLDCLGVFGAVMAYAEDRDLHFYNFHYNSGLGLVGKNLDKYKHLFNERGYLWR